MLKTYQIKSNLIFSSVFAVYIKFIIFTTSTNSYIILNHHQNIMFYYVTSTKYFKNLYLL